ncbi:MAG: hypothetical protein V1916_03175 [Patescibacteria group bacterium]
MHWANFFHIYQPPAWPAAIIDQVTRECYRPLLRTLRANRSIRVTMNVSSSLTEQLVRHGSFDVLRDLRAVAARGQVELVSTACYHPILPLIPPAEALRQIRLNDRINRRYLGSGYRPRGFFLPEMAYSSAAARLISRAGFRWIILDEIAAYGTIGQASTSQPYRVDGGKLAVIFRNRTVSDYLSFHADLKRPRDFWAAAERDRRNKNALVTAMDGENLGHHRHGLGSYWERLVQSPDVSTLTVSELIRRQRTPLHRITPLPASWSSQPRELRRGVPYILWNDPTNPIHRLQWQLLRSVTALVSRHTRHPAYPQARALLDQQLASDQFWWASAKPWWSLRIIEEKARALVQTASLVSTTHPAIDRVAGQLIDRAQRWQSSGRFLAITRRYLHANEHEAVRYIGGKKISLTD